MTPEQIAALVGAFVLCLGNLAALIKVWTDNAKVIKDRLATKIERDRDSTEIHDKVLKLEFQVEGHECSPHRAPRRRQQAD